MQASPAYNAALKASGYNESITLLSNSKRKNKKKSAEKRKRTRKMIGSIHSTVRTSRLLSENFEVGREAFPKAVESSQTATQWKLVTAAWKTSHPSSRHTTLASSVKAAQRRTHGEEAPCNCRHKDQCPLNGACLTTSLVYKATVTTADRRKEYFGLTEGTFKAEILHPTNQL